MTKFASSLLLIHCVGLTPATLIQIFMRVFFSRSFVAQMPTLLNHRSDSNVKIMDRNETTDVTRKYRALK